MLLLAPVVIGFAPSIPTMSEQERIDYIILSVGQDLDNPYEFHALYKAILWNESQYNHNTISYNKDGSYDIGIAQLNSKCIKYFKERYCPFDPTNKIDNLYVGAKIFRDLLIEMKTNNVKAVMAYNCGPNRVHNNSVPCVTKIYTLRVLSRAYLQIRLQLD